MVVGPDSGSYLKMDCRLAKSRAQLGECMLKISHHFCCQLNHEKTKQNLSLSMSHPICFIGILYS